MTLKLKYNFFLLLSGIMILGACSTTKHVPEDEYLLQKTDIQVDGENETKKLKSYIKQKPNKRFLGIPIYIYLYNLKNEKREKGLLNWLSSNGEAPEITDTILARRTALQLEKYYFNRGYFQATADFEVKCKKRKSFVRYTVTKGEPYLYRNIEYTLNSPDLDSLMQVEFERSILKSGRIYNVENLDKERQRLSKIFRNNGFYDFSKEYIYFEVDSAIDGAFVDVVMGIENKKFAFEDSIAYIPHSAYSIRDIYVYPGYNARQKIQIKRDTSVYNSYHMLLHPKQMYKERFLSDAIHLKIKSLYLEKEVTETYEHYLDIGVFRKVDIEFYPIVDTTAKELDAHIFLQARKKHTAGIEGEGTHSSGRFGIAGNLFYRNINTFKGGEIFDIRLRGAIETQPSTNDAELFNAWEVGLEGNLKVPRFLLPFNSEGLVPKKFFPKTQFTVGYYTQIRTDFTRDLLRTAIGYSWNPDKNIMHQIELIDLSFVALSDITDSTYIKSQRIRTGYEDAFIPAIGYTYIFNNQSYIIHRNYNFFTGHIEFSGNILNALAPTIGLNQNSEGQFTFAGVPVSQYVKAEADSRYYYFVGGKRRRLTLRMYGGLAVPYGNSSVTPFEKQFFTGGSNDLRGWVAYTQWPGSSYDPARTVNTGDLKMLLMTEYRFGVIGNFESALFVDIGNTWLLKKDDDLVGAEFDINRFYKEFGISPGIGFRYDFGFFVFRLDAGVKLYQPQLAEGKRWTPNQLNFRSATWSLALGYPF